MGFRLYIKQNGHEFCMGKLYGYTNKHLYSLDYLISLGYFEEELEEYDRDLYPTDYEIANASIDCTTYWEIKMQYPQFLRFISLYLSDRYEHIGANNYLLSDFIDELEPFKAFANGMPVKLSWE